MSQGKYICVKGARVNNLKNVDVDIPRNKLIVVTGLSGSGKSSLAFDTLYAEGQRRYVESLNSYARQFLGRMSKPECDFIKGLPPAIAIEQKVNSRNPRSTVGTTTEIYSYLCLLFARIGQTFSPVSGEVVKKHDVKDVVKCVFTYPQGTRFMIMASLRDQEPAGDGKYHVSVEYLSALLKHGYARLEVDGETIRINDLVDADQELVAKEIYLLIDRMTVDSAHDAVSRLTDSVETAFFEGNGVCFLRFVLEDSQPFYSFSKNFEADGITFEEPSEQLFSFNSPMGACPVCEGFGRVVGVDRMLVIPNRALSVYDGAVVCWRGEKMKEWKEDFIRRAKKYNFPVFEPYYNLTEEQQNLLWHGDPKDKHLPCIDAFFEMLRENQYKIQFRVMLARYRGKTDCPECHGSRLKKEAGYVKVGGRSISELCRLPVSELKEFLDNLQLTEEEALTAKRLLLEISRRVTYLVEVGLDYITLGRLSNSLSGGESQRINLTTSLGSSLVGSLYILDEPSIGLHSRDTGRLITVLRDLQRLGNTVIVVEHDEDIIRAADYIIDVGPEAGRLGGQIVYKGDMKDLKPGSDSYTVRYLLGEEKIPCPTMHRQWNDYIMVKGARENNLKNIDVKFPLNVMTVVTGVSGSGKSSLVHDIFYNSLKLQLDDSGDRPGEFSEMTGDIDKVKNIEYVDQNPIGKSSRSNPVTYIKAYDEIRKLMAAQTLSRQMGYSASYFSFNQEGGRCEECKGEGVVVVPMQFMADLELVCESCHGKRFKKELLEVKYKDLNIYDILQLTVNQAVGFFKSEKKIVKRLKALQDVGLGYIKLGQSSSTLSGGENQRVKLAYYLSLEKVDPTIFVFDEPTTGLHFHDIRKLLSAFDALLKRGHTVIIVEHNMDVIKCADYVIDLGPEGGKNGGHLVACGTPEDIIKCESSYTGQYLKEKLNEP
jgi:excinuclease ABC subunit A